MRQRYQAIVKISMLNYVSVDYESDFPIKNIENLRDAEREVSKRTGRSFKDIVGRTPAREQGGNKESQ